MEEPPIHSKTDIISPEEARVILSLQLLLARAANKDGLAWWDDESLTPHAGFLLGRIFPLAPALAARSLALSAARARHQAALDSYARATCLYRLDSDNRDQVALRSTPLLPISVPDEPIRSMDVLERHLRDVLGEPATYVVERSTEAHGLQIEIPPAPAGVSPMLHQAQTLAWAYLEGAPEQSVFPFVLE
jgi:hypothetical protein